MKNLFLVVFMSGVTMTTFAQPAYTPYIDGPASVCPGQSAIYHLNNYYYECEVNWDVSGGDIQNFSQNFVTVLWNTTGASGGIVTANTSGTACETAHSDTQVSYAVIITSFSTITPNLYSEGRVSPVSIPCGPGTISFNGTSYGSGATYHWVYDGTFSGPTTTTVPNITLTYVHPGSAGQVAFTQQTVVAPGAILIHL